MAVVAVVVNRPLPRVGGMVEDNGAPKARQLLKVWTRGRKETDSPNFERRIIRRWTVQNEMRGVLGCVSADAALQILDFADAR